MHSPVNVMYLYRDVTSADCHRTLKWQDSLLEAKWKCATYNFKKNISCILTRDFCHGNNVDSDFARFPCTDGIKSYCSQRGASIPFMATFFCRNFNMRIAEQYKKE